MTNGNSLEIEVSPIGGRFARSGTAVNVRIYRLRTTGIGPWALEVLSEEGRPRFSQDGFATDQDAFKTFYHMVEENGIGAILAGRAPVGKSTARSL